MKKILKTFTLLLTFVLSSSVLMAQEEESSTPKWISDKGFWIIESNVKTPDTSVIHFYNNDKVEIYSEQVQGITLNLKKRKTLMGLKKVLDESVVAWQQSHLSRENKQLVSNILQR